MLREAAEALRAEALHSRETKGLDALTDAGYEYVEALDFLDDACVAQVKLAYEVFKERERRMHEAAGVDYGLLDLTADYFERLSNDLSGADVDPGFRLPISFKDWCQGHQPNVRPVTWR